MTRYLPILSLACASACLYHEDFTSDRSESDKVSCSANWDCPSDEVCGAVLSEPNDETCAQEEGWLGLDDKEVRYGGGFEDQDSLPFVCIDTTRYFPYCTHETDLHCEGDPCPPNNLTGTYACGVILGGSDEGMTARCVEVSTLETACGNTTDVCGATASCVRLLRYEDDGPRDDGPFCINSAQILPE